MDPSRATPLAILIRTRPPMPTTIPTNMLPTPAETRTQSWVSYHAGAPSNSIDRPPHRRGPLRPRTTLRRCGATKALARREPHSEGPFAGPYIAPLLRGCESAIDNRDVGGACDARAVRAARAAYRHDNR